MGYYVYKYVYDGEIVYIGKNDTNLKNRIKQHEKEEKFQPYLSSVIYFIELANKAESKAIETFLINKYKPSLNVADKYESISDFLEFTEPEWKEYGIKKVEYNIKKEEDIRLKRIKEDIQKFGLDKKYSFEDLLLYGDVIISEIKNCFKRANGYAWFRVNNSKNNERIFIDRNSSVRMEGNHYITTSGDNTYIFVTSSENQLGEYIEVNNTTLPIILKKYNKSVFVSDIQIIEQPENIWNFC